MSALVKPERAPADGARRPDAGLELLDVGQVAALLGCSKRHVARLLEQGAIPEPVRLGRLVRWGRQSLAAWIARGCPACDPLHAQEGEHAR
jgi:excisionase family DNA binding protein